MLEHLQEDPLSPLVEAFLRGVDYTAPVEGEANLLQLLRKLGNILIRNLTGMLSRLDRIVLSRQAISIETDGEQDIICLLYTSRCV